MTAYNRVIDAFTDAGLIVQDNGRGQARAQAPGHSPADRSVILTRIEGSVLIYSHSDPTADVLATLNLTQSDLFDVPRGWVGDYPDGRRVHRTPDKKFRQSGNTAGTALFRADRLSDATCVYVVEGEKDVLAAEAIGLVACCTAMGAGKAHLFDLTPLHGKHVIVVRDRDRPGHAHAQQLWELLRDHCKVEIAEARVGKDLADHVAAGLGADDLIPVPCVEEDTAPAVSEDPRPRIWPAEELERARQISYLATNRLPLSAVSYMLGPEGIGKSLWTIWLVALITTGKPFAQFGIPARGPQNVVLVLTEDDWSTVVRPRLEVAGADLRYVRVICSEADGSGSPTFPADMPVVVEAAEDAALVVVDAWADTLPGSLSVKDPQQARRALHPWKELATRTGTAVLLTGHTNREKGGNVRNAYGLSGEIRKKARMTILAQPDPDVDGVLVIGPEKSNLTAPVPASRFEIQSVQVFERTEDSEGTVPKLVWIGDAEQSARDYFADSAASEDGEGHEDRNEAEQWLEDYLTQHGRAAAKDVKNDARKVGISERTIKRAAQKLSVVYSAEGFPRTSRWSLPDSRATQTPVSSERGPTGPTGSELGKQDGPTGPGLQLGQGGETGPTERPAANDSSSNVIPLARTADRPTRSCALCNQPLAEEFRGRCHVECALKKAAASAGKQGDA